MSTSIETFKRGDRLPSVLIPLTQGTDAAGNPIPVDLTNATGVTFSMRSGPAAAAKVNASAAVIVTPATQGLVRYDWLNGDLDTVGDYLATVTVSWPGAEPQTFPQDGYLVIRVEPAVTDVPVFGATWPIGYVSVARFKASPEVAAVNLTNLITGGDQASQDAALGLKIAQASDAMDGYINRTLRPATNAYPRSVRINRDYEGLVVPYDQPFRRVTAASAVAVPGSPAVTIDPTTIYPTFIGQVPTLHVPLAGVGLGPGGFPILTLTIETGYAATQIAACAAAATQVVVDDPRGLSAGDRVRFDDPGKDEVLTVAATYVPGSATVPVTTPTVFAHAKGTPLTSIPLDLEEAAVLWTLGLLGARGGKEDEFADAPVSTTSTARGKRMTGTGYTARARALLDDGGYMRVIS